MLNIARALWRGEYLASAGMLFATGVWTTPSAPTTLRLAAAGGGAVLVLWGIALVARRSTRGPERVILLGSSPFAAILCREVAGATHARFRISGVIDDAPVAERMAGGAPWVGTPDQLDSIVLRIRPDRIVLAMTDRRGRVPEQALLRARLRGVKVEEAIDFYERVAGKLAIESIRPSALIMSGGFRRLEISRNGFWWRASRLVECVTSSIGLMLLAPVAGCIALLIKIDSRGSVFFVQPRVGCGGRPFGLVKFRTMHESSGARSEWVADNADRVTRVGKWLRRFRIDEWPQLLNVLRGEMSYVGPRPHPVSNYRLFMQEIPYYHMRELVRPGITGWAQVRYGYANNLAQETEKMRFDVYYIKHRSLWLDVQVLFETALLLVFDRQSHQEVKQAVTDETPARGIVAPRDVKARPALR